MSDDASARLALPYLAAGQMQKHVTLNEALTRLDALVQLAVVSRTTAEQPPTPADGDLYLLPDDAEGADWAGRPAGTLMRFEAGGWTVVPVQNGVLAVVLDAGELVVRHDGDLFPLGDLLGEIQQLDRLGLGTTADADNPFSARLNKALWTARETGEGGDGDLRLTLNKQAAGDVLSLLFQSGYGGRAELGLIGDDDFGLKVSDDGVTWREALSVDRATGRVTTALGAMRVEQTLVIANSVWTPPAWARWVEVVCVGAGGGGAGGVSKAGWPVASLTGPLTFAIGNGGAGGASNTSGVAGQSTLIVMSGATLLAGAGGGAGSAAGTGGAGGLGLPISNGGGASLLAASAWPGSTLDHPFASGGGGGGGGIDAANTVRNGGSGGDGGLLARVANGGVGGSGAGSDGDPPANADLSWAAGGGAGGGASVGGTGNAGGDGGDFGAGGGGGGAGLSAGGVGGDGSNGLVVLRAFG